MTELFHESPPRADLPEPSEDRGTHYTIWRIDGHDEGAFWAFNPFPRANRYSIVSVPIGWSLAMHQRYGAVLVSVALGERQDGNRWFTLAQDAVLWGRSGCHGFRLVAGGVLLPLESIREVPRLGQRNNLPDTTRFP